MKRRWYVGLSIAAALLTNLPAAGAAPSPDPLRPLQWGLDAIGYDAATRVSTGRRVIVAVVDTGVESGHPDLRGNVLPGFDATRPGRVMADPVGHGTHIAGIIAARTGNGIGIAGVAPAAKILPVRVFTEAPAIDEEVLARGIRWAADHGAKVMNLSWGYLPVAGPLITPPERLKLVTDAIQYAWARGVVVVAAAMNNSVPICSYPASAPHVVCVGAVDRRDTRSYYSNSDAAMGQAFLVAPGGSGTSGLGSSFAGLTEDIMSTVTRGGQYDYFRNGYTELAGTSMAAPHVAGVAALLAARGMTNAQIVERLLTSATDLGPAGRDQIYGSGRVNAARALRS